MSSKQSPQPQILQLGEDNEKKDQSGLANVTALETKLAALTKQMDDIRRSKSTLNLPAAEPKSFVGRLIARIDRWGDPDPRPRTIWGGLCTVIFVIGMVAYAVVLYMLYRGTPAEVTSKVLWSVMSGPYPLRLTCYSEKCLVSWNFDAASAQAKDCVAKLPPARCVVLGPGEKTTVDVCYSQLPGQGLRLHFGGEPAWGDEAAGLGLSDETTQSYYGFATTSTMAGGHDMSVMLMYTPLRAGVTQLQYVRTDNGTLPDGDQGRERHEWFSTILAPTAPDSDFLSDPCMLSPPDTGDVDMDSMKRTTLLMHPDYTHITVEDPPSFVMALVGEIGGASETYSVGLLCLLLLFYKVMHCKQRQRKSVGGEVEAGEDTPETCCQAVAHAICP